ncbi:hypothetical protein [Microvirga rosea]|uniref:hypothetical protein n=1 Tax=Microvirga rosea TaxID=2715425 RepID=UPI001D0B79AF|nr:hypothetical protein [Microvirga rosea]MCB8822862.1 hypothetical protein [Microvirga rosea]
MAVFRDRLWDLAIVSGGASVVARTMARRAWKRFEASLRTDVAHDTDDVPYLRDRDFRNWDRIGFGRRNSRSLCSGAWLIHKLIYLYRSRLAGWSIGQAGLTALISTP